MEKNRNGKQTRDLLKYTQREEVTISMEKKIVNGIDADQVQGMIGAVKKQPMMAQAKIYAKTKWISGFNNEASIKDFELGGRMNTTSRKNPFTIAGDHPPELLGTNKAPASVEVLLAALGHCISNGFAMYGAAMGIPVESVTLDLVGDIDLQGLLMLPEPGKVRPGFQEIRATYYVKSNAPNQQLEKLAKMAEDFSPVRDSLRAVKFTSKLVVQ
jgi:uncharacterized OsmC-like protein